MDSSLLDEDLGLLHLPQNVSETTTDRNLPPRYCAGSQLGAGTMKKVENT